MQITFNNIKMTKRFSGRKNRVINTSLLFMAFFMVKGLSAQNADSSIISRQRYFMLTTGYSQLRMLDKQVSPLIYRADIVPLGIGYYVLSEKKIWGIHTELIPFIGLVSSIRHDELNYNIPSVNNEGELENEKLKLKHASFFQQEICVWYQRRIQNAQIFRSKFYVGCEFKHYLHLSLHPVARLVMNEIGINPKLTIIRDINERSSYNLSFSFPLTGIMVRLPYANDPADGKHGDFSATYLMGSEFFTPLSYQRLNFAFGYNTKLSKKWDLGIAYKFDWFHYSKKRGITAYENQILVLFTKKLKNK